MLTLAFGQAECMVMHSACKMRPSLHWASTASEAHSWQGLLTPS